MGPSRCTTISASAGRNTTLVRTLAIAVVMASAALSLAAPAMASARSKSWKPPCSVVKQADVEKALGVTVTRAQSSSGPVPACRYFGSASDEILSIWLNAKPLGTAANTFKFDAEQAKKNEINKNFQTVHGVGKRAFFFESDLRNRLEVLVGKRLFFIDGATLTLDQATVIAKLVLSGS